MAGKFTWTGFAEVDLQDEFFDSLKRDYVEFSEWFNRKAEQGEKALAFIENSKIYAFIYLKEEEEAIKLQDKTLPIKKRIKIGTLKLSEQIRNIRLGEGAIGVALWRWKESCTEEIYLTAFETHKKLIILLEKFGFRLAGKNSRGECLYIRSRKSIDYHNAYSSFPFINPSFTQAGLLPIDDSFHDLLFPYSELKRNKLSMEESVAGNGITKIYIASPYKSTAYQVGEPVCIYRRYTGGKQKGYNSVVTSFATINDIKIVKSNWSVKCTIDEFIRMCSNKTIFKEENLRDIYRNQNVVIIQLVYNGYFGAGNNVNYFKLKDNDLFKTYPYNIKYTRSEFESILEMGRINIKNIYN